MCMNFVLRDELPAAVDPIALLKTFSLFKNMAATNSFVINPNTFWLRTIIIDHILLSNLHSLLSFWLQGELYISRVVGNVGLGILAVPDRFGDRSCCFLLNDIFKCVLMMDIRQVQLILMQHQENLLKYKSKTDFFRQLKEEFPNLLFFLLCKF